MNHLVVAPTTSWQREVQTSRVVAVNTRHMDVAQIIHQLLSDQTMMDADANLHNLDVARICSHRQGAPTTKDVYVILINLDVVRMESPQRRDHIDKVIYNSFLECFNNFLLFLMHTRKKNRK